MEPSDACSFVARIFQIILVYRRLALENRINSFSGHIPMFFIIEKGRRVLPVENNNVNGISCLPKTVQYDCLGNRVTVRQIGRERINKMLFVDLALVSIVRDAV